MIKNIKDPVLVTYPRTGGTFFKCAFLQMTGYEIYSSHCESDKYPFSEIGKKNILDLDNKNQIITIVRNPIDSVSSFAALDKKIKNINFFENINIKLSLERKLKNYNDFFNLIKFDTNSILINFDNLISNPQKVLENIADTFNIEIKNKFNIDQTNKILIFVENQKPNFYITSKNKIAYKTIYNKISTVNSLDTALSIYNDCLNSCLD